jgi:ketosteroid isomerase-like protein
MSVEKNKEVCRRLLAAVGRNDIAAQIACFQEGGRIVTMGSTCYSGVTQMETLRALVGEVTNIFPDGLEMTIHNIIGEGDCVAVEAESHGTHISGKHYNNKYHLLFHFKDGLIREMKEYFDTELTTKILCAERPATK